MKRIAIVAREAFNTLQEASMAPVKMHDLREEDVRTAAKVMGYDLLKVPHGYQLTRDYDWQKEIVVATTLELIADFLKR